MAELRDRREGMIYCGLYFLQLMVGALIGFQIGNAHGFAVGLAIFVVIALLADIQFLLRYRLPEKGAPHG